MLKQLDMFTEVGDNINDDTCPPVLIERYFKVQCICKKERKKERIIIKMKLFGI